MDSINMESFKKLLVVICFSAVFLVAQTCSASTNVSTYSGGSHWLGTFLGAGIIAGGGIAIALASGGSNSDNTHNNNNPEPTPLTPVAGSGTPVILSSSNYNLLSINGVLEAGTITVFNNNNGPSTFSYSVSDNSLIVDKNSSCLTKATAANGTCTFNISYTGDAKTNASTTVLFTVKGTESDTLRINLYSRKLNTFFAPTALATKAHGIYGYAKGFAAAGVNGTGFLYVLASSKTYPGGVYKTNDQGKHWILIKAGLELNPGEYLLSMVLHNDGSLYVGSSNGKVFKLNESTSTWTKVGDASRVGQINVLCSHDRMLYAGGSNGIFVFDGTTDWMPISNGWPAGVSVLSFATGGDGLLYAGTNGRGVYKLNSDTWSQITASNSTTVNYLGLNGDLLYAGITSGSDGAVYSLGKNNEWKLEGNTLTGSGGVQSLCWYNNTGYAGTVNDGIHQLTNESWKKVDKGDLANTIGGIINALYVDAADNILYAAVNGAGVYFMHDGNTWESANNNEATIREDYCFCKHQDGYLYVGTTDAGVFRSKDGGANWELFNAGLADKNIQALHSGNDTGNDGISYLYAGTSNGKIYRVDTSSSTPNWINTATINEVVINSFASDPRMLYIATNNGVRSSDHGSNPIAVDGKWCWGVTAAVGNLALFNGVLYGSGYATTSCIGVYYLNNPQGGSIWKSANFPQTNAYVFSLYTDGNGHLYAGSSSASGDSYTDNNVYRLDNSGSDHSWKQVGSSLNNPVRVLVSDETYLYAGLRHPTDTSLNNVGVYRYDNNNSNGTWSWSSMNNGDVTDSTYVNALYSDQTYMYVATGGGIYKGWMN